MSTCGCGHHHGPHHTHKPHADAVFRALDQATGVRLFTVTVCDPAAGLVRRAYSSMPADYPVSGTKPMQEDGWSDIVMRDGKSFVANTTPEFAAWFPDHEQINGLGCQSAMNIPVKKDGQVIATVNLLDGEGYFTPIRVMTFEALVAAHHDELLEAIAQVPMGQA